MVDASSPPKPVVDNTQPPPAAPGKPPAARTSFPSRKQRLVQAALVLAACVLLAIAAYYVWQTWFAPQNPVNTAATAVATRGNLEDTVTATGTLRPKDYVDVGTQIWG